MNLYNFVENNPINWVDFLGLVDLSYTPPAETDLTDWEKGFNTDDKFDVAGHGNSQSMFDKNKKPITPNKVADDIIKDPKYKPGDTVGLISCSTGAGNNSFAQKLADALAKKTGKPTTVRAPTKTTYPGPPGGRPTVPGGVYKDFKGKP